MEDTGEVGPDVDAAFMLRMYAKLAEMLRVFAVRLFSGTRNVLHGGPLLGCRSVLKLVNVATVHALNLAST